MLLKKFRAWNGEKMIENVDIIHNAPHVTWVSSINDLYEVQEIYGTVMQYTGKNDVNNKLIYEGDIVKITINDWNTGKVITEGLAEVMFKRCKFGVCWGIRKQFSGLDGFSEQYTSFLVVGNIYENANLIEG